MTMTTIPTCEWCRRDTSPSAIEKFSGFCASCAVMMPEVLRKAVTDQGFQYMLRLHSGEVVLFHGATVEGDGEFLNLMDPAIFDHVPQWDESPLLEFERGMTVRISQIVWCTDAPYGT